VILIVDDEGGIREFLKIFLEAKDFRVISAGSGEEAIDLWNEHEAEIDLVITDVVMPGMDGKVLSERLRARKPDLRIIFMSGHVPERIAVETLDGAFFKKPFNPMDLLEKVQEVLNTKPPHG
jgi:two-component system, cell cycle sensor histidine kinase and response regulator CckA